MTEILTNFHFLRPLWLLLIPLLLVVCYRLYLQTHQQTGFEQWIDKRLLDSISTTNQHSNTWLPYILLALFWTSSCFALAGPVWKKIPQPLFESTQAMTIVLDLSPSMMAEDIKPSRLIRARLKIQDLLKQRKDGLTALIVYGGEAHIVTPLTSDSKTIVNLLPELEPGILPIPGSNIEMAIETAMQLLKESGFQDKAISLFTDGIAPESINSIKKSLSDNTDFFIIGLGTEQGAPIPVANTGTNNKEKQFLRDSNNKIVTASRNDKDLNALAQLTNGHYLPLQASNSDIDFIINSLNSATKNTANTSEKTSFKADQWHEFGPTLILLLLPFFALLFRRGWLLSLVLAPLFIPQPSYALSWSDLWLNQDQRALKHFEKENYQQAKETFTDKQWQGAAAYKNKDYQAALEAFSQGDSAVDFYNKGNALAQLQQYDQAIEAYETALIKDPDFADAKNNKALIEQLQQQQSQNTKNNTQNSEPHQQTGDSNKNQQDQQQADENQQSADTSSAVDNSEGKDSQESKTQDQENKQASSEESSPNEEEANHQKSQNTGNQTDDSVVDSDLAELSDEERQELEQWLRKVPDDPSGLLRRKFNYEFQKRRELYQQGKWQLPDNNAHQRY